MNKTLFNSEKELINFLTSEDCSLEEQDVENILGIEFAYKNGKFESDLQDDEDLDDQETDTSKYKVVEEGGLPEKYPCLMVYHIEDSFDRFGSVAFQMFEYVYLSDFNKN